MTLPSLALKYASGGVLFVSLFYLVLTGKMQASDYQTLATTALGALGGFHAGASRANPTQPPDKGKE